MKKKLLIAILILCLPMLWSQQEDLVIMVDISASMNAFFDELVDYLESDLLKDKLAFGKVVHILSFSAMPEIELVQSIEDQDDRAAVFRKLQFLQPIGLHTDLVSAIKFLLSHSESLPQDQAKEVYLLTDGVHDPPPGSLYDTDSDKVISELLADARAIKKQGWTVHILQMPMRGAAAQESSETPQTTPGGERTAGEEPAERIEEVSETERESLLDEIAEELNTEVIPWEDGESRQEAASNEQQERDPHITATSVQTEAPSARIKERRELWPRIRLPLYALLAVLAAVLLVYLLLRILRSQLFLSKMDEVLQPARKAFSRRPNPRGELIEMRVKGQNPRIGYRNIHRIKRNRSKTVGGGRSHFLIFLVPFPQHAADISYDGSRFHFSPKKWNVFPELKSDVENCLDTDIPASSRKGYELTIRFQRYVSPLEEINRILTLTIQNLFFGS